VCKFAEERTEQINMEDEMSNSWEYLLIKRLMEITKEERYYYVKREIHSVLMMDFIEREYTDKDGEVQMIYKKQHPSSEWIGRTLRKLGVTGFKRDGTGSMYFLSPKIVMDLITRLQLKSLMPEEQTKLKENGKI